ncbi:MAG: NDP-hexose 2,3-dehydratase family protein [Spirochaetia bacterium]|nr:NDP-hexose 2,3-dehydratase family protein [Spirochaetia bacterium]
MSNTVQSILKSWCINESSLNPTAELLAWIKERNNNIYVNIEKKPLKSMSNWFYDEATGKICNKNNSFFSISGIHCEKEDGSEWDQPIILQNEIGYLGIICKNFDGIMHFLMQAKIEPGNVNKVQISPTIQATKSNFTLKHGGAKPLYLDYFQASSKYEIIVDQIQSEQASCFYKKRNRNIIIRVEGDIPVYPSHRWMTLGQIKALMHIDNLVNMDTRTVLSCIPFCNLNLSCDISDINKRIKNKTLFQSIIGYRDNNVEKAYNYINNIKMSGGIKSELIPLSMMKDWELKTNELVNNNPWPFKVIFCDVTIEGREVKNWNQPFFEATGSSLFGLLCVEDNGVLKFLVKATVEVGCFDCVELGPTVRYIAFSSEKKNEIDLLFDNLVKNRDSVMFDNYLSEEGGRFYHECNRNVIVRIKKQDLPILPDGYFLFDYKTLNSLVQINNTLNIQLRNLLSLLEV